MLKIISRVSYLIALAFIWLGIIFISYPEGGLLLGGGIVYILVYEIVSMIIDEEDW